LASTALQHPSRRRPPHHLSEDDRINLHKLEASCTFCGATKAVRTFREEEPC